MKSIPKHESKTVEFKAELTDNFEKEVVAFLNSATGGDIYLGIANDSTIVGVNNADDLQLKITHRIKANILPTVLGSFDVFTESIDDKIVIRVVISRGVEKPYYLKKHGLSPQGAFIRVGTSVQPMEPSMIEELFATRTRNSLRNIRSPRVGNHSFSQLKIYYEEKGFEINDSLLHNLDFYTPDGELNYVAYLFADTNSASFKVAKYLGTDKIDLIENEEYGYCSLIKATNQILDKLDVENNTFTKITGAPQRLQKRKIDPTALREALVNAMVHNDYSRKVTPVIEIYADRLCITSYGGLVEGLSRDEFFKGRSMVRNREIMRIFKDLDLVEQLGSGMNRILGKYPQSIFHFSEHFLEVVFPYADDFYSQVKQNGDNLLAEAPPESLQHPPSTPQAPPQVKNLILAVSQEQSREELQTSLNLADRKNFRKNYLQPAISSGLLEMTEPNTPNSPTQKYRLSPLGIKLQQQLKQLQN